jgi:hypothetical protein
MAGSANAESAWSVLVRSARTVTAEEGSGWSILTRAESKTRGGALVRPRGRNVVRDERRGARNRVYVEKVRYAKGSDDARRETRSDGEIGLDG